MAFYAGKGARFLIGAVAYRMKAWSLSVEYSRIDVTNFESPSDWREFLNGFASGTVTANGPFDPTLPVPGSGTVVTFTCQVGTDYVFTGTAWVVSIKYSTDIENSAQMELSLAITGAVELDLS